MPFGIFFVRCIVINPRNFAFGEDSHALPLTSELDALCVGECEPDLVRLVARGAIQFVHSTTKKDANLKMAKLLIYQGFSELFELFLKVFSSLYDSL